LRSNPEPEKPEMIALSATDPANLYGSVLRWPAFSYTAATADAGPEMEKENVKEAGGRMLSRSAGARVILRNGELVAYMRRNNPNLSVFLPAEGPERTRTARDLANFLAELGQQDLQKEGDGRPQGMLLMAVNDMPVQEHFVARFLVDAGFQPSPMGFNLRRVLMPAAPHAPGGGAQHRGVQ
jgi:ATP-dependent Lhr-like helicase